MGPIHKTIAACAVTSCLAVGTSSCTYLKYAFVQKEYERIQRAEPSQMNVKHMIERDTFFVHGQLLDPTGRFDQFPKVVAAYSSKYQQNELVGTMLFRVAGSHYGLNLPDGDYTLLVLADIDRNGVFESSEVVGRRLIELSDTAVPERVLGQADVAMADPVAIDWSVAIDAQQSPDLAESLFYPAGTIRDLDDPIFDADFATLGMYDPASFLEQAPTMFYAMEEDLAYKIPVVFVHGIGGSAREFAPFVERLDRERYKPWFFHYPSGGDLEQLAELFYQIFLSGRVYESNGMPLLVVAHSMGGLVAREAINLYRGEPEETRVTLLVTMASPLGGHPAAAAGVEHGIIVLPSWRDLNPASPFVTNLFRKPLPDFLHHELIYAFEDAGAVDIDEDSDGVVPLFSQLDPRARSQASAEVGFNDTHVGLLDDDAVISHVQTLMDTSENRFSESHLRVMRRGGYDVVLGSEYTPEAAYYIRAYGQYLMALSEERLEPDTPDEAEFVEVVIGERHPRNEIEEAWLRFLSQHPELRAGS